MNKDINYYKNLLEKAGKAGLVAKRVWVTRDGKPYQKTIWVREGDGKEVTEVETGDMISEDVLGMSIKKYSDKSVLIAGDTYGNIEKLREIKKEVGAGTFNRKLKGWVFPYNKISTVLGKLLGNPSSENTADATEKKDNMTQLKNAYSVGQEVNIRTTVNGKSVSGKATISGVGHDGESVKYTVKINTTGKQIDNVDESEFDALPEKDNKKVEEALNNATEATRTSVAKKIFGTVKDAILRKEVEGSSNKAGILDLQKKRESMIARLRGLATLKKSPEKKSESGSSKKKSEYSGRASMTRKELDAKLKSEGMMSVTEYYQAVYGELPVFNRVDTEDTDALSRAMMGNKNAAGKRGGKDETSIPRKRGREGFVPKKLKLGIWSYEITDEKNEDGAYKVIVRNTTKENREHTKFMKEGLLQNVYEKSLSDAEKNQKKVDDYKAKEDPEEIKRGQSLKKQFSNVFEGMKNSDTLKKHHMFLTPVQATLAVEDFNKYASEDVKKKMRVYVDPNDSRMITFSRQLESPAPKPEPKTEPKKEKKPSSWMDFTSSSRLRDISAEMKKRDIDELKDFIGRHKKKLDLPNASSTKQRIRQSISDAEYVLKAKEKFEDSKKEETDSSKRSEAMQGNQNAKKDGKKEDEPKKKETKTDSKKDPEIDEDTKKLLEEMKKEVDEKIKKKKDFIEAYDVDYKTTESTITGAKDGKSYNVTDHTALQPKDMKQIKQKNILEQPRPNWIPEINQKAFAYNYHHLYAADAGDGTLIVSLNGWNYRNRTTGEVGDPGLVRMTREHYAMTLEYYKNRQKAINKQEAIEQAAKMVQKYKEWYGEDTKIPNKYLKPRGKAVKTIGKGRYLNGEIKFMKEFTPGFDDGVDRFRPSGEQIKKLLDLRDNVEVANNNLNVALEDYSSTYHKGKETSYGDSGTKDKLFESHGIKVKNQDGSEIDDQEIDWIKGKMDEVFGVFGNRASMSKDFNLKVSSARDKRQHASKAIGMFIPAFNAIGVSRVLGSQKAGFTLGHEFAHFMDYHMANKEGNGRMFASHDPNHIAGKISDTFRDNMNKPENKGDKYLGNSHECFARALEQYQAMTVYGDDVVKYNSPQFGEIKYSDEGSQVNAKVFNEKIKPLIEQMLKEKDEILKSMDFDVIDMDSAYNDLGL